MTQDDLVDSVLADYQAIDTVPASFEESVRQHIAARPSPETAPSQMDRIESKLDELLAVLRGGTPE